MSKGECKVCLQTSTLLHADCCLALDNSASAHVFALLLLFLAVAAEHARASGVALVLSRLAGQLRSERLFKWVVIMQMLSISVMAWFCLLGSGGFVRNMTWQLVHVLMHEQQLAFPTLLTSTGSLCPLEMLRIPPRLNVW